MTEKLLMKVREKIQKCFALFLCLTCFTTGCAGNANSSTKMQTENSVEQVLQKQIEDSKEDTKENSETKIQETAKDDTGKISLKEQEQLNDSAVDIDMTKMSSDMVYATVYQMMSEPESYVGKVIRIRGNYSAVWYEPTAQYYHYVMIQDATACCGQGLEFVWGDGSHSYPEEYPKENAEITVTGKFETYTEEGDENLYNRLSNATMQE